MSTINKAGQSPILAPIQPVGSSAPAQSATPAGATQNVDSNSAQWSLFTDTPQNVHIQGQLPGTPVNTVFRHQVYNQQAGGGAYSPFNSQSWQSTGILQLDSAIDQAVDKMFFDPKEGLGLPTQALGERRRMGMRSEIGAQTSGGDLSPDPMRPQEPLIRAYGMRGQTLGQVGVAALDKHGSFFNVTPGGGIATGYGQVTALAARARAYGGINPYDMSAEFGVEANATLLELRGGLRTNQNFLDLGFLQAGRETRVDARLYAGADAWADARVSFNNGPRVRLGAGAFAGASAEIGASDTIMINGRPVAGAHGVVKAWAGAGAKLDIDVGFENGKLDFRFDVGAALGVGIEIDFGFSIDFKAAAAVVKDVIKGVVGKLFPFLGGGNNMNAQMQQQMMMMIMQQIEQSMKQHTQEMSQAA